MNIKNSGVISTFADEYHIGEIIFPAFFIGRIFPLPPGDKQGKTGPGLYPDLNRSFKEGQFVFEHQYEGMACTGRKLLGIFLPLSTASDPKLVDRLQLIVRDYHPFQPYHPTDQEARRLADILQSIGPLYARKEDMDEAFFRVATKDAYPWISKHFKYVSSFVAEEDEGWRTNWRIGETEQLSWKTPEAFAKWLGKDKTEKFVWPAEIELPAERTSAWLSDEEQVKAAEEIYAGLIYQNSD